MTDFFTDILILSDFDGTFIGKNGRIVEKNIDAINYFKKHGGYFAFSTGRLPLVMDVIYPDYVKTANAPSIMSNGAIVYDVSSRKIIKEIFFDSSLGKSVANDVLCNFPNAEFVVYPESGERLTDISPNKVSGNKWRKMNFVLPDSELTLKCRDYVNEKYSSYFNAFRSGYNFLELVDSSATKGNCISYIKNYFKIKLKTQIKVFGIGDFENDINMLEKADVAFCPSNAIDEVKQKASHILCDHDSGAIADMVEIIKDIYTN